MRTDTTHAVAKALEENPSLTVKEYAGITLLSLGTVYRALEKIHAQQVPGTYPVQWIPAPENSDLALYVDEGGELKAQIHKLPSPKDVGQMGDHTLSEASAIAQTLITSGKLKLKMELGTDLGDYRKELGAFAAHIVTMLWHVENLIGKPEWKIKAGLITDVTKDEN